MMAAFPPFSLVGPEFIIPNPLEIVVHKYPGRSNLVITDINHTILLKVRPHDTTFHDQLGLLDADDKIIAILRPKFKLNSVTLANNMRSNGSCDMRVKGNWTMGNITIYVGDSSTAIAQMHKPQNEKFVKDKFTVTIQPNMDYAGVVALFAIADALEHPEKIKRGYGGGKAGAAFDVLDVVSQLGN